MTGEELADHVAFIQGRGNASTLLVGCVRGDSSSESPKIYVEQQHLILYQNILFMHRAM
jgi:hypothetical protein